ncbi:MAG: leucine-rich repeat protein [Paludibacteraceae bacterium]|nr:leucine-rich repeat protein [Paludibacteraceae bacterium]
MRKIFTFFVALLCAGTMMAALPQGALNGLFTINADGEKIIFSQGNLQATTEDLGVNWTWSFATNQYDYIGNAAANTAINGNGTVSSNGTIDLFGWSTAATTFGIHNSKDNSIYSGDFVDWGVNAITNGGNKANAWRTLTKDEWVYLFYTRTGAATLFGLGSVNGVNGLILLPDNWDLPTDASFTPSTTQGLEDQGDFYKNSNSNNFSHNTYTTEQWAVMESAGAVFLPAAGFRTGTDVDNNYVGSYGYCWSASTNSLDYPYRLNFTSGFLRPQNTGTRDYGMSVRLVKKAPVVGDTIQYEYKGNNLFYMIIHKNDSYKEVGIVGDGTAQYSWAEANKPTGALFIPDSVADWQGTKYAVTTIYQGALRGGSDKLTSIDFSDNTHITTVAYSAFMGCSNVTSVTLSDEITDILGYAFDGSQLTSIDFKNVKNLGMSNFYDCNIANVFIPKSLTNMTDQTYLFRKATTITCDEENPSYAAVDNVLYNKAKTKLIGVPGGYPAEHEIHILPTVTSSYYGTFRDIVSTIYLYSEITFDSHGWGNSPKGKVVVGCGLLGFYTTGNYEGAGGGSQGDFCNITSIDEELLWTIDAHAAAHGSVAIIDTTECNQVLITATPDEGYVFNSWSNGLKEAEITIDVDRDTTLVANFAQAITHMELEIGFPDKGAEIVSATGYHYEDYKITVSVDNAEAYYFDKIIFYQGGEPAGGAELFEETVLKPSTTYKAHVFLNAENGYAFPDGISKNDVLVNGEPVLGVQKLAEKEMRFFVDFTTSAEDQTGIGTVTGEGVPVTGKIIRDGQLYLMYNGTMYNVQGAVVK